jgi:hypothetical protein
MLDPRLGRSLSPATIVAALALVACSSIDRGSTPDEAVPVAAVSAPVEEVAPVARVEAVAATGATEVAAAAEPAVPSEVVPSPERGLDHDQRELWTEALRAARTRQIERIRAYRRAGRFPTFSDWGVRVPRHRTFEVCDGVDVRGKCSPVFIDEEEVDCAVASLMRASGWGDQAEAIARSNLHVRVEEVTDGPLHAWILRSGLTQDEVAMVQPSYQIVLTGKRVEAARRRQALTAHFLGVERKLLGNTEISLEIALARLVPAIRDGLRVEAIGGPPPPG